MRNINSQRGSRLGWIIIAGIAMALGLLGFIIQYFNNYPSIADLYRPSVARIEHVVRRKVRQGKSMVTLDFYSATYPALDVRFPTTFATRPDVYHVGDTVRVIYDPERPEMNLVYDERSHAVHLPEGADLRGVAIIYDDVVRLFDSLDAANR